MLGNKKKSKFPEKEKKKWEVELEEEAQETLEDLQNIKVPNLESDSGSEKVKLWN
jgi:hypothetical protein